MAITDTLTTREAVRQAALADLIDRCRGAAVPIEGGPLDGIEVVSLGTLEEQVRAALDEDLPPPSDRRAEVSTPATVLVFATCPECSLPVEIIVSLSPKLVVDLDGAEISVKAKSKGRVHVCGQLPLPVNDSQDDFGRADLVGALPTIEQLETALLLVLPDELSPVPSTVEMEGWSDLEKRSVMAWAIAVHLVASDNDDIDIPPRPVLVGGEVPVVETCPFPGCGRIADHSGDHDSGDGLEDDGTPAEPVQ